jgi:trans-aconitate methyltransferase
MSGYAVTAQFYDVVASAQHSAVNAQIAEALTGLETMGYPVVDVGAGTGLTTQVIATALPEAEILAVEPDPAMRPALMARVWSNPDLRRRVSILPMSILAAPLPPVVSAAIASATLVHFSPQERERLWALLSARLSPAGRAVIEIQCPIAQDIPEACIATAQVGQVAYEGWASAQRIDESRQHWRIRYVAQLGGVEIDHQCADYVCWVASAEHVLAEADAFGFAGCATNNLVVLRKATSAG